MLDEHCAKVDLAEQRIEVSSETVEDRNEVLVLLCHENLLNKTLDRFGVLIEEETDRALHQLA